MLHAGLDLSRRRLDVCVISESGELVEEFPAPPDGDGLRYLVKKVSHHDEPVRAVIESMTGARFVHDTVPGGTPVSGLPPGSHDLRQCDGGLEFAVLLCRHRDSEPIGPLAASAGPG